MAKIRFLSFSYIFVLVVLKSTHCGQKMYCLNWLSISRMNKRVLCWLNLKLSCRIWLTSTDIDFILWYLFIDSVMHCSLLFLLLLLYNQPRRSVEERAAALLCWKIIPTTILSWTSEETNLPLIHHSCEYLDWHCCCWCFLGLLQKNKRRDDGH